MNVLILNRYFRRESAYYTQIHSPEVCAYYGHLGKFKSFQLDTLTIQKCMLYACYNSHINIVNYLIEFCKKNNVALADGICYKTYRCMRHCAKYTKTALLYTILSNIDRRTYQYKNSEEVQKIANVLCDVIIYNIKNGDISNVKLTYIKTNDIFSALRANLHHMPSIKLNDCVCILSKGYNTFVNGISDQPKEYMFSCPSQSMYYSFTTYIFELALRYRNEEFIDYIGKILREEYYAFVLSKSAHLYPYHKRWIQRSDVIEVAPAPNRELSNFTNNLCNIIELAFKYDKIEFLYDLYNSHWLKMNTFILPALICSVIYKNRNIDTHIFINDMIKNTKEYIMTYEDMKLRDSLLNFAVKHNDAEMVRFACSQGADIYLLSHEERDMYDL